MAKRIKTYRYIVEGHGFFPVDMLRYDTARIVSMAERDLLHEMGGLDHHERFNRCSHRREVEIEGVREPTEARWASFGWVVHRDSVKLVLK